MFIEKRIVEQLEKILPEMFLRDGHVGRDEFEAQVTASARSFRLLDRPLAQEILDLICWLVIERRGFGGIGSQFGQNFVAIQAVLGHILHLTQHFQPIHLWHPKVQQDDDRLSVPVAGMLATVVQVIERLDAIPDHEHFIREVIFFEGRERELDIPFAILRQQDAFRRRHEILDLRFAIQCAGFGRCRHCQDRGLLH